MKIKVGQWVRTQGNRILEVTEFTDIQKLGLTPYYCGTLNFDNKKCYSQNEIIKVKDTPRELIQVGDLIINKTYWNEPLLVTHFDNQGNLKTTVRTSSGGETISINKLNITKILTPNGKDYICQWELEQ